MYFEFDPHAELPLKRSAVDYLRRISAKGPKKYGPSIESETLVALVHAVLKETLPEYVGRDGFYNPQSSTISTRDRFRDSEGDLPLGMEHLDGMPSASRIFFFEHPVTEVGRNPELEVRIKSPTFFMPSISGPTIKSGYITGFVPFDLFIPDPTEKKTGLDVKYLNPAVVNRIAKSILYGEELSLGRDSIISEWASETYFPIANPTLERMQDAIENARRVEAFFKKNPEHIQRITQAVGEAMQLGKKYRDGIEEAHRLIERLGIIERETGLKLHEPRGLGYADKVGDARVEEKLTGVKQELRALAQSFPRSLMEYVSPTFYTKRGSFFE